MCVSRIYIANGFEDKQDKPVPHCQTSLGFTAVNWQ